MNSSQFPKKLRQHRGTLCRQDPTVQPGPETEGFFKQVHDAAAGSHIGVGRTVDHLADPGIENSAGTHGARLQRHVQGTVAEPPASQFFAAFLNFVSFMKKPPDDS